jgi:P pilus assembly chaperone PapD
MIAFFFRLPSFPMPSLQHLWLGGVLAATIALASPAQAQVGLSPLIIEIEAERGQAEGVINVTNNTNEEFRARVYVEPFTYTREDGFETLPSDPNDLTPYLQFSPRELVVPPNTTRRVRFVSRFPPSLAEGEYRAVIFTETLAEAIAADGAQVSLRTRVGATVYVRNGDLSPELAATTARYSTEDNQVQVLVQNLGQASVRTQIAWELRQGGQVVRSGQSSETSVLAETERFIGVLDFAEGDAPLASGTYELSGELQWLNENRDIVSEAFQANFTIP